MKAVLSEKHVPYSFADITASMADLKAFLLLRDTSEAYAEIRGTAAVGIPMLLVDSIPYVLEDEHHAARLVSELKLAE